MFAVLKRYIFLLAVLFLLVGVKAKGQVPGYLGKRFAMGYSYNFFPGINLFYDYDKKFYYKSTYSFKGDFFCGRRVVVGFNYTIGDKKNIFRDFGFDKPEMYFNQNVTARVNLRFMGVELRKYFSPFIAPLGKFIRFGIDYVNFGLKDWTTGVKGTAEIRAVNTIPYEYETEVYLKTIKRTHSAISPNFGFGYSRAVGNFLIDFGFTYRVYFSEDWKSFYHDKNTVDEYLQRCMIDGIRLENKCDLFISIKYML